MNWIIAESNNYILSGEYESAYLIQKSDGKRITCVGDFYGNPMAGIIDKNEKYCVTVGCGIIVYRLSEPFEEYTYDKDTLQWYEIGRNPEQIDWIVDVTQISDTEIKITDEKGNVSVIKINV